MPLNFFCDYLDSYICYDGSELCVWVETGSDNRVESCLSVPQISCLKGDLVELFQSVFLRDRGAYFLYLHPSHIIRNLKTTKSRSKQSY
jgi:hypothetical protein